MYPARAGYTAGALAQGEHLRWAAENYFFRHGGWRRRRALFSHAGVVWSGGGAWTAGVWFVGRRGRRGRPVSLGWRAHAGDWGRPRRAIWRWYRVGRPGLATLLARVRTRLTGRIEIKPRRVAWPLLRELLRGGARGVRVACHGRFTRRQRASHEVFTRGRLARGSRTPLEQTGLTAPLRFGAVGLTVWVAW